MSQLENFCTTANRYRLGYEQKKDSYLGNITRPSLAMQATPQANANEMHGQPDHP
jgi:hypothetical protein